MNTTTTTISIHSPASTSSLNSAFNERFVQLCDGRPGLREGLTVSIREPMAEAASDSAGGASPARPQDLPVLDFIASNETIDRYDEILCASGWRLENYRRNPVFQNAHQYGDVIFTLGKALVTEVRGGGSQAGSGSPYLFQRIEFAVEANPIARIAYGLYKGGFLNAVSVGFIPIRWEDAPQSQRSGCRRKYLEQELLEVSAVGIPANPDALRLGLKAGVMVKADLKELLEVIREICTGRPESEPENFTAVPITDAGASGVRSNEAQVATLLRALREILRRA